MIKKTCKDSHCLFVTKLDNQGNFQWVNIAKSPGFSHMQIIVDDSGNCFVKGSFLENMKVGRRKLTIKKSGWGFSDWDFLWKIKPNGKTSTLKSIGVHSNLVTNSLILDMDNNLLLTGGFYDWGTFRGLGWRTNYMGLYLAKYKP
jgi:hypothetical protein